MLKLTGFVIPAKEEILPARFQFSYQKLFAMTMTKLDDSGISTKGKILPVRL